jgi:hypothetical protein
MTPKRKRLRRALAITGWIAAAFSTLWLVLVLLMWHWVAKPPALAPEAATFKPVVEQRGDRLYAGKSWYGTREGLPVLYLTGTAYEMGYANGLLTQKLIHRQEDSVLALLNKVAPQRWLQFAIKAVVLFKNRNLPDHVTPEQQWEVLGLSRGCPDKHPDIGPYYHRLLNYHGAQDISYMMMNSPLLRRGCTAFGAWGEATRDGHLLMGRNFDWEADPVFEKDRVLVYCEPKDGIAFVSLAWAGMIGSVSGMNRAGVSITVNGAPSHLPNSIATPTCLIAREVLQHARDLDEALKILERRKVFVSSLFLLGSRKDGAFIVVEKTPERMFVRREKTQPFIVCANHYQTPELDGSELNKQFKRIDTSVSRYERMKELLGHKALTPADAAMMLRDRELPNGQFAGNGHRGSLNPLIATHAVVMDVTEGILWAATPPHQLGRFVAFSTQSVETVLANQTIPEDELLTNGGYARYLAAQSKLEEGWKAFKQKDTARAETNARTAEGGNPGYYGNAWLLAEALLQAGRTNEANQACRTALAGQPALPRERTRIEQLLSLTCSGTKPEQVIPALPGSAMSSQP